MYLFAKQTLRVTSAIPLLVFLTLGLFSYLWYQEGTLDSCKITKRKLVSALVKPYSGTAKEPHLLEPVALALARKGVNRFVEQKSQIECALILYHLWRNPKQIKSWIRELSK